MDNKDNNKKNSTNQTSDTRDVNVQKNTIDIIIKINEMRGSKEKMTFKESAQYLWSFIILGVNWIVYKKVFFVLITALILVGALVWLPQLGFILCLLTPIFLAMYGKYLYHSFNKKYSKDEESKKTKILIPSSLLIIWVLIIFVGILLLDILIKSLIM